jgi:hypothetical protein
MRPLAQAGAVSGKQCLERRCIAGLRPFQQEKSRLADRDVG